MTWEGTHSFQVREDRTVAMWVLADRFAKADQPGALG